jgi:hypothetical protein
MTLIVGLPLWGTACLGHENPPSSTLTLRWIGDRMFEKNGENKRPSTGPCLLSPCQRLGHFPSIFNAQPSGAVRIRAPVRASVSWSAPVPQIVLLLSALLEFRALNFQVRLPITLRRDPFLSACPPIPVLFLTTDTAWKHIDIVPRSATSSAQCSTSSPSCSRASHAYPEDTRHVS